MAKPLRLSAHGVSLNIGRYLWPENDEPAIKLPARMAWHCYCGSILFELHETDAICAKCREPARGWSDG